MKTTIECEKCGAIHVVKFKTTEKHIVKTKCPFCEKKEEIEVGR